MADPGTSRAAQLLVLYLALEIEDVILNRAKIFFFDQAAMVQEGGKLAGKIVSMMHAVAN